MKEIFASAGLAVCCLALLAAVALSVPLWLGFDGTVQAGPHPGNTGWRAGQTAPTPTPTPTPIVSQGRGGHNALSWHTDGYKGKDIKVGIIDFDFKGFSNLQGKELPTLASTQVQCYTGVDTPTHTLSNCEDSCTTNCASFVSHGTSVAEIIHDMAPSAKLYISNVSRYHDDDDLYKTVKWMADQGVGVINYSVNHQPDTPGDGSSGKPAGDNHVLDVIDYAVNTRKMVWVNSAGNDARHTWYGALNTPSARAWHRFPRSDTNNSFSLKAGTTVNISLRWADSWGGADCDLNMYLYRRTSTSSVHKESSFEFQTGGSGHTPYEFISHDVTADGVYFVSILRHLCTDANVPSWMQLLVWGTNIQGSNTDLEHYSSDHHIGVPAESANAGMLAVGAAGHSSSSAIKNYSNQGPAVLPLPSSAMPNGRIEPDLVGASHVSTKIDSPGTFPGTSAAAPHLAGMAALVLNRYAGDDDYDTPAKIVDYLKRQAIQRIASPDPNKTWGHGFATLPSVTATAGLSAASLGAPSSRPIFLNTNHAFTLTTNLANSPGVKISVNHTGDAGKVSVLGHCRETREQSTVLGNGGTITFRGCKTGSATIRLYHNGTNREIRRYDIRVSPQPNTLRPPTNLRLSTVSSKANRLELSYTRSQSPHYYEFDLERRDLSARTETWTVVDTREDSIPAYTFRNVDRGYHYRAKGHNCADSNRDSCGAWGSYSPVLELSDPGIAISGLTGSYIAGDTDAFSVTLSDLTLHQPYTVTLASSQGSVIGFNYLCNHLPSKSFTPLSNSHTIRFTLHACQIPGTTVTAQSGTVTAKLWKGVASGSPLKTVNANATVTKATGSLSPLPTTAFKVGHDQTFTLNTNVPSVYITATLSGDAGRLTLPTDQGCHQAISGRLAANGNTITIRGCVAGAARLTLHRTGSIIKLAEYTVTVNASTTKLSPDPSAAAFTVGHDRTFTVTTDIADDPGLWIGATYTGDSGRLTMPSSTQGCHQTSSGLLAVNGNTITLRGCIAGTATLKVYRRNSSVHFATYTVTVNASTTKLSPDPAAAAFTVGHDRTFTVTTDIADDPGLWIGATYTGDSGRLTMPSSTQGCHQTSSGLLAVNGNTITLRGCIAGTATLKVYRRNSSVHFATYTVTVNASTTKLSPTPATFTAGHDQTFTVTTDIADNPGLWIGATYRGDSGRLTMPSSTQGCHQARSGLQAANGNTITLRGCIAGTATLKVYRRNSSVHFATYTVTVNASNTSLSPTPATFTIGTNQTFAVTTDIPNTPGLWIGFNYPGDTGRLLPANQSCSQNPSGIAAVTAIQGGSIALKPCTAGTVTIKVNRSYSSVTLVTYTVTINSS